MSSIQYKPLDKKKHEIRILTLHLGCDGPIQGSLATVSLDDTEDYEALSYTWGDINQQATIVVNGVDHVITVNAAIALWHLRRPQFPRRLWIDTLCINQQDHEERLHQVQLMKHIYLRASDVLAWLGPSFGDSDFAMDLIKDFGNKLETQPKPSRVPSHLLSELQKARINSVIKILYRNYWSRVWVLQEVAVATADPLVGCGDRWIPWSIFRAGIFQLSTHVRLLGIDCPRDLFFDVDQIRRSYQKGLKAQPAGFGIGEPVTNMYHVLDYARYKGASDSRDSIYALLGLMRTLDDDLKELNTITPDYRKTVAQVYSEATKMFISLEQTLEILNFRNHLPVPCLPSWVPDFTPSQRHRQYPANASDAWRKWSASGPLRKLGFSPSVSEDLTTLFAYGSKIDTVRRILQLHDVFNRCPSLIRRVRETVISESCESGSVRGSAVPDEHDDTIWRTLVGNRSAKNDLPCPANYADLYRHFFDQDARDQHLQGITTVDTTLFQQAMRQAIATSEDGPCREFIISSEGLLGLGPPHSQPGDCICLLVGYSMPVLLRSCENYFQYIGNAYIHGIMHGEGQPPEVIQHASDLLSRFVIR